MTLKDIPVWPAGQARRKYSSEDKIRIVLEGLRGETSIAEICRREGLNPNVYYRWSKDFLEAGKRRLDSLCNHYVKSVSISRIFYAQAHIIYKTHIKLFSPPKYALILS